MAFRRLFDRRRVKESGLESDNGIAELRGRSLTIKGFTFYPAEGDMPPRFLAGNPVTGGMVFNLEGESFHPVGIGDLKRSERFKKELDLKDVEAMMRVLKELG